MSSNDFNRAVAKIESHYGASPVLDSPSLKYIDISILHAFFEAWCYKSDIVNTRNDKFKEPEVWGFESSNDFLDVMRREAEKDKVVWGILEGAISIEGLVGLLALYDCHGSGYSEEYLKYLDYNERDLLVNVEEGSPGHQYKVLKLVSKPRAGEFILRAIFLLGHHALAEEIIGTHNLAGCFDWLDKARSRELFIEPYKSILAKTLQSCSLG